MLTEAVAVALLLQDPPETVSDSEMEEPVQTVDEPDIVPAVGSGSTVTVADPTAVPHELVTE